MKRLSISYLHDAGNYFFRSMNDAISYVSPPPIPFSSQLRENDFKDCFYVERRLFRLYSVSAIDIDVYSVTDIFILIWLRWWCKYYKFNKFIGICWVVAIGHSHFTVMCLWRMHPFP